MENNSRKINLEITGIPTVADEDCKKVVYALGKLLFTHHQCLTSLISSINIGSNLRKPQIWRSLIYMHKL